MKGRTIIEKIITDFGRHLREEEKSDATTQKYIRDVMAFKAFADETEITKETVIAFKQQLMNYKKLYHSS